MKAIILAAGEWKRLRPLTNTIPKPIIKIFWKTIIEHNLEHIYKYVSEIIIVVKYKADEVEKAIWDEYKKVKVSYREQSDKPGTAWAIMWMEDIKKDVIILNGDSIFPKKDLKKILELDWYWALAKKVKEPEKYGIFKVDEKWFAKEVIEKPETFIWDLANVWVYKVSSEIFRIVDRIKISKRWEYEITDAINFFIAEHKFKIIEMEKEFIDVWYCWDILDANSHFLKKLDESEIEWEIEKWVTIKWNIILEKCEDIIGINIDNIRDYLLFYTGKSAVSHLYKVSAGLDSMLVGEDQILGQVKDAIEFARECDTAHLYLNTLFRDAVTEAKKIKTETMISKSGVSTATLALRAAKDVLNSFSGKNILIIGASGKIGDIVLKNALSYDFAQIYVTRRRHNIDMSPNAMDRVSIIEYNDRYDYIKNADVIVSATSGPHFTLTKEHIQENIVPGSKKVFIDLAVPCDIDERVSNLDNIYYYNMDDMKKFADENNEKKKISIEKANAMTDEGVEKFLKWALFQENLKVFSDATENLEKEMARIGEKKTLEHLFYKIRDNGSLEALQSIIDVLSIWYSRLYNCLIAEL